jgi:hypothetical protein
MVPLSLVLKPKDQKLIAPDFKNSVGPSGSLQNHQTAITLTLLFQVIPFWRDDRLSYTKLMQSSINSIWLEPCHWKISPQKTFLEVSKIDSF